MIPEDTPEDRARDHANIERHAQLVEMYQRADAQAVMQDIYFLTQIALFKMYMEQKAREGQR